MKTDVLFIHRQLSFAVGIKQALERTGNYDVHPFTSVEAAMEYLRGHPQDVALVDFMMPVYSGEEIVGRLRDAQPQITLVATPTQSEDEFARLGLHGMLPGNFTAREFIPAIERALEGRRTGELPKDRGAGLLGRVQTDEEKRPPTSTIGYRSLESILDEGPQSPPIAPAAAHSPNDSTWVGGLPAVPPPESEPMPDAATLIGDFAAVSPADDISFLDDVLATPIATPVPLPTPGPIAPSDPEYFNVVTDRLPELEKVQSDQLPSPPPLPVGTEPLGVPTEPLPTGTEPLGFSTEPLPPLEFDAPPGGDLFADFDPEAFGAEFGTRPLAEIDAAEAAARLGAPRSDDFVEPEFPLAGLIADDEDEESVQPSFESFPAAPSAFVPGFEQGSYNADDPFAGYSEDESGEQPVDYMAFLDLQPSAGDAEDAPPWLAQGPVKEPSGPSDDEVIAGLQALFGVAEPEPQPEPEPEREPAVGFGEYTFDDVPQVEGAAEDEFAGVLGEIDPDSHGVRQNSPFDDLVASMSTSEQRPPLPARQQQYVDVALTDDMSSLLAQLEQARTGADAPGESDEAVDLTAVLFVDDEDNLDTPSTGARAIDEPAMASPEELAALFGAPRREPAAPAYDDFESLLADRQAVEAEPEEDLAILFAEEVAPAVEDGPQDQDFEVLLASFGAPAEPGTPDFEAMMSPAEPEQPDYADLFAATTLEEPAPAAEPDLSSLFASDAPPEPDLSSLFPSDAPPEPDGTDFNAMFGVVSALETGPLTEDEGEAELDIFGGEWGENDVLALDQEPRFEETGTVSDLMTGVEEVTGGTGRTGMLTHLTGPLPPIAPDRPERPLYDTTPAPPPIDDTVTALLAEIEMQLATAPPPPLAEIERAPEDDTGDTPARRILETANDAEQTDSSFSVNQFLDNIEAQLPPNQARVQPLPSWMRQPAPAPESLPEMSFGDETVLHSPLESADETMPHGAAPEAEPAFDWDAATFDDTTMLGTAARAEQTLFTGDEETSWLEFIEPEAGESVAAETLVAAAAVAGVAGVAAAVQPAETESEWEAIDAEAEASARALQAEHIDDPYIAQLALNLTDVSLELTADAVLLTRGRDIAAFAGRMSRDELLELRAVIDDDWEAAANDARIRFLRLPESGKDVMLYSRRTVEDLTLSLVFDGAMPLRDIRLQGKRLMDALAAVPEAPVEVVLAPTPEEEAVADEDAPAVPRSPHAYVWLLRDPEGALARPVAQAIVTGLNQQLTQHGWRIREMRASEDHVYMLADSPDEQPPYKAVRELMRRSAQIAHVQNPALDARNLWAEAYLVVTPGRSLETDEIQQFIQFERML